MLIKKYSPKLLILSHAVNFDCGALAWVAFKKNINTVILYGEYGSLRFWRPSKEHQIFMRGNFLNEFQIKRFSVDKQKKLEETGKKYLKLRLGGEAKDIGAVRAFNNKQKISKKEICKEFKWSVKNKIICIYSLSWIDFVHLYGGCLYENAKYWINDTLEVASKNKNINWIIKRHPLEKYYQSGRIEDFINISLCQNIKICPDNWEGNSLLQSIDGVVTLMGTVGIEAASLGKIVILGDKGWYGESDFCYYPKNKTQYRNLLSSKWSINKKDKNSVKKNASIFACWHFCVPDWQKDFMFLDDFKNEKNYMHLNLLLKKNQKEILNEIQHIRKWFNSNSTGYHSYKMNNAQNYKLSNI